MTYISVDDFFEELAVEELTTTHTCKKKKSTRSVDALKLIEIFDFKPNKLRLLKHG
jgi:hypothetical protein